MKLTTRILILLAAVVLSLAVFSFLDICAPCQDIVSLNRGLQYDITVYPPEV